MSDPTRARMQALHEIMARTGTGLVALAPGSHMQWVLGFHPYPDERPCLLLVGPQGAAFLMPALNAADSRARTDIPFFEWADEAGPAEALGAALAAVGASRPGLVALDECMRADFALLVLGALPAGTRHAFTIDTLGALRMRKDAGEIAILKRNAAIADGAVRAAFAAIRPGMTENQLADVVRAHFAAEGAVPEFWIVGAGANGAFPHHHTGDSVIRAGDAVVIDIGGRVGGYPSDITRMAVVGDPPEGFGQIHNVVDKAVRAAIAAARPGVPARTVDEAARKVIADAGYGEYFVHRTGHGLGIDIHEPPYITATSDLILQEGMVFSIEPGIYLPGRFGVRLEEIVVLRAEGAEVLSGLPRDAHYAPAD